MRLLDKLLDVVAPYDCVLCQREGSLLCAWCWHEAFIPIPSRCYHCFSLTDYFAVCSDCRAQTPVRQVWIATPYKAAAKDIVRGMKFEQQRQAALLIARKLHEVMPYFTDDIVMTHIPTATRRVRERGFDHSKHIARELAQLHGVDYIPVLARRNQLRQVGTSKERRRKQAQGAFRTINERFIVKKHIILVDDVITTGASMEEAAYTLKRSGARRVDAAIFAQTT